MARNKLWLIDENQAQLRTSASLLARLLPGLHIVPIAPLPSKPEYAGFILNDPETACVVIDQKLQDTGIALYSGIELAEYLRTIDNKLPLYILTNYIDEREQFAEGEWSVEDIVDKSQIGKIDSDYVRNFKARLLRRVNIYDDILSERQSRFHDLLSKSLNEGLSPNEARELENLQGSRSLPVAAMEADVLSRVENALRNYEDRLKQLGIDQD